MIGYIIKKFDGSKNDREVKRLRTLGTQINEIEASLQSLPDDGLRQKTADWKARPAKIEDNEQLRQELMSIVPEAFAVVKNACRRLWGKELIVRDHPLIWEMIPFDVELIGGYPTHTGRESE